VVQTAIDIIDSLDEDAIIAEMELELGTVLPGGQDPPTAPLPLPESAPVTVPATIPPPDAPITYVGPGLLPTWNDVFAWANTQTQTSTPDLQTAQGVSGAQVAHAIQVAQGTTIKALSGFINQTANLDVLAADVLGQRITDVENVISALNLQQVSANSVFAHEISHLVNDLIPALRRQLAFDEAQIQSTADDVIKIMQVWTTENIFNPLETQLAALKASTTAQVNAATAKVPSIIATVVPTLGLASAASLAAVASQVSTLVAEDANCVQPMCSTMGPNTALGKLLKALNLAADAALLAELLSLTEPQLIALIQAIVGHFASLADDFAGFFTDTGETLGSVVTSAIGSVL